MFHVILYKNHIPVLPDAAFRGPQLPGVGKLTSYLESHGQTSKECSANLQLIGDVPSCVLIGCFLKFWILF